MSLTASSARLSFSFFQVNTCATETATPALTATATPSHHETMEPAMTEERLTAQLSFHTSVVSSARLIQSLRLKKRESRDIISCVFPEAFNSRVRRLEKNGIFCRATPNERDDKGAIE